MNCYESVLFFCTCQTKKDNVDSNLKREKGEQNKNLIFQACVNGFCCCRAFQCKHEARLWNQSFDSSLWQIKGTGNLDIVIETESPTQSSYDKRINPKSKEI